MKFLWITRFWLVTASILLTAGRLPLHPATEKEPFSFITSFMEKPGCSITLQATNKSRKKITLLIDQSEVRAQAISWSNLHTHNACKQRSIVLEGNGSQKSHTCELKMECQAKRQYKFRLKAEYQGQTIYKYIHFPSASTYLAGGVKSIDLGDLGRHF